MQHVQLRVVVKGETHVLDEGDNIYYDGETLNEFTSVGAEPLDVVGCITPPAL